MWLAIVGYRTPQGTTARTRSPSEKPVTAEEQRLVVAEAICIDELGARVVASRRRVLVELDGSEVGHLASTGRIERGLAELREEEPVLDLLERADLREHVDLRVADELSLEPGGARELGGPLEVALDTGPRDLAMPLHLRLVAVDVDQLAALLRELDRELEREPVRRRERECLLAGDRLPVRELVEQLHPAFERLLEALLLGADDSLDLAGALPQLGVCARHLLDHDRRQPVEVV